MTEALGIATALVAGIVLAGFFLGGLWWTVRFGLDSPRPALWFLGSFLVRTGVVVLGFYFVSAGDWRRFVAALVGFVVARVLLVRRVSASGQADHAS